MCVQICDRIEKKLENNIANLLVKIIKIKYLYGYLVTEVNSNFSLKKMKNLFPMLVLFDLSLMYLVKSFSHNLRALMETFKGTSIC